MIKRFLNTLLLFIGLFACLSLKGQVTIDSASLVRSIEFGNNYSTASTNTNSYQFSFGGITAGQFRVSNSDLSIGKFYDTRGVLQESLSELKNFTVQIGSKLEVSINKGDQSGDLSMEISNAPNGTLIYSSGENILRFIPDESDNSTYGVTFYLVDGNDTTLRKEVLFNTYPALKNIPGEVFGFTKGQHSVNENGAFSYALNVAIPDGPAGMKPSLSLNYSSQGSDGILGVGWSLGGLSTVGKSPSFIDLDDKIRAIKNDGNDQFNLDGDRLITVEGGVSGGNGTEYRTETNNFSRIISFGRTNRVDSWEVQTQSGLTYEYGKTEDSRIRSGDRRALFWAVNRITSTTGNYIDFKYRKDFGPKTLGYYPLEISYGGNLEKGTQHTTRVVFVYEDRPDPKSSYVNGLALVKEKRVKEIRVFNNGVRIRSYQFEYQLLSEANVMSKLKSIREIGINGQSFRPLNFEWLENGNIGLDAGAELLTKTVVKDKRVLPLDVNGDGYQDIMLLEEDSDTNENDIYLNRNGSFELSEGRLPDLRGKGRFLSGDFNADGRGDLFWYDKTSANSRFLLSDRNGEFSNPVRVNTPALFESTDDFEIYTVDGNGDGFTDILTFDKTNRSTFWFKNLSTKDAFISEFEISSDNVENSDIPNDAKIFVNDVNGDGLADLLFLNQKDQEAEYYENITQSGSSANEFLFERPKEPFRLNLLEEDQRLHFGNWNGDNLSDLMLVNQKTGKNIFFINDGDGTFKDYVNPLPSGWFKSDSTVVYPADWNGDRFTDLVVYNYLTGASKFLRNRDNFSFSESDQIKIDNSKVQKGSGLIFGDWTGEGVFGVLWYDKATGENLVFKNQIKNNNLIAKITDGSGQEVRVKYSTLRDTTLYEKATNGVYPNVDFQGSVNVVDELIVKDGIGGDNKFSYKYANGKMNIQGRGFRGFERFEVKDEQSGITTTSLYNRSHLLAGHEKIIESQVTSDGDTLGVTYYENESRRIDNANFSFVKKKTSRVFELDGGLITQTIETMDYDDYGNVINHKIDYGDGFVDETVAEYDNIIDDEKWLLGRLKSNRFIRNAPNAEQQERKAIFTYDSETGLLKTDVVEPDIDSIRVEMIHNYDSFGNEISTIQRAWNGQAMEDRETKTTYDVSGRYAIESINALGHKTIREYDKTWGFVTRMTDPNELSVQWQYDGFGRKTREIRVDGSSMTKAYRWTALGEGPDDAVYKTLTQVLGRPDTEVYFDMLGRQVRSTTKTFGGKMVYVDMQYDNRGRMIAKSEPYFSTASPIWNTFEYDQYDRVNKTIEAGERTTEVSYQGLRIESTNPLGQVEVVERDVRQRTAKIIDALGNVLTYTYDAQGNLLKTTDPENNEIVWTYDKIGRQLTQSDPDLGEEQRSYNAFGELLKSVNAKNHTVKMKYDALGRIIERVEPEGTTNWTFDSGNKAIGKLSNITSFDVSTTYAYDDLGRLKKKDKTIDSEFLTMEYEFGKFSRIIKMIYPKGYEILNEYDEQGYLTGVKSDAGYLWQLNEISNRGEVMAQTFGDGARQEFNYEDETGWMAGIRTTNSDTTFQDLSYAYDKLGNVQHRSNLNLDLKETFTYDDLNRLIIASVNETDTLSTQYDRLGNITFKSDIGTYTYGENGAGPHAVSSINGEGVENWSLASALTNYIEFTSFQKASRLRNDTARVDIYYDEAYQRSRISKTVNGELLEDKYYFDNWFELRRDNSGDNYVYYIRAKTGVIAQHIVTPKENTTNYWLKDNLGSLETLLSEDLSHTTIFSFDAWGRRRDTKSWTSYEVGESSLNSRGFTGHEHYDLLSLIDMNGRVYDPVLARFTSPDPFLPDLQNIQAFNRYAYVLNNPLAFTDPSGYFFKAVNKFFNDAKREVGKGITDLRQNATREISNFYEENKEIIVPVAVGLITGGAGLALASSYGATAAAVGTAAGFGFGSATSSALMGGASLGQALEAGVTQAVISGVTAYASAGVGDIFTHATGVDNFAIKALAHGTVQGASAEAQGGDFGEAFVTGAVTSTTQLGIKHIPSTAGQIAASVLVGGTVSELQGGSFKNGAVSAAMIVIYNDLNFTEFAKDLYENAKKYYVTGEMSDYEFREAMKKTSCDNLGCFGSKDYNETKTSNDDFEN